jgi:hypothetical protein
VDVTSYSLDNLPIYAYLGISEVWRYADGQMEMFGLHGEEPRYEAISESIVLPPLTSDMLVRFVEEGLQTRRPVWIRRVREWARSQAVRPEPDGS